MVMSYGLHYDLEEAKHLLKSAVLIESLDWEFVPFTMIRGWFWSQCLPKLLTSQYLQLQIAEWTSLEWRLLHQQQTQKWCRRSTPLPSLVGLQMSAYDLRQSWDDLPISISGPDGLGIDMFAYVGCVKDEVR